MKPRIVDLGAEKRAFYQKKGYHLLPENLSTANLDLKKYVAIADVRIDRNASIVLAHGSAVYFEPGAELTVNGEFIAEGENVLTSIPRDDIFASLEESDSLWEGVTVAESGRLICMDGVISAARQAITAPAGADTIALTAMTFLRIKQTPVTIRGEDQNVKQGMPSLFSWPPKEARPPGAGANPDDAVAREPNKNKTAPRIAFGSALAVGASALVYGVYQFSHNKTLYRENRNSENYTNEQIDEYKHKAYGGRVIGVAGSVLAAIGVAGLTFTIIF